MSQSDITRKKLSMAFIKLQREAERLHNSGGKPRRVSISSVAREAGVSHTLIHTKYPDIAICIRATSGTSLIEQRKNKTEGLKRAKTRISDLRQEVKDLQLQNLGLASENGRLLLENSKLKFEIANHRAGISVVPS